MMTVILAAAVLVLASIGAAAAGEARVEAVRAEKAGNGRWRFDVTVRHADEGWDHYANAFVVETVDGTELGRRVLAHPHVDEQPFTRRLNGVAIGADVVEVRVYAVDSVDGPGPAVPFTLPRSAAAK